MNRKERCKHLIEQWFENSSIEEFIEDHKRFNLVGDQKDVDSPLVCLITDEEHFSSIYNQANLDFFSFALVADKSYLNSIYSQANMDDSVVHVITTRKFNSSIYNKMDVDNSAFTQVDDELNKENFKESSILTCTTKNEQNKFYTNDNFNERHVLDSNLELLLN